MAFLGKNTVLQLSISSVYTTVADIVSINGPSASVEAVEVTTLNSDAKEFLASIPDYGDVSFSGNYNPANATHTALTDLIGTPAMASWKIIFANTAASVYAFDGILTGFNITGVENNGKVTFEGTIKVSGVVEITV